MDNTPTFLQNFVKIFLVNPDTEFFLIGFCFLCLCHTVNNPKTKLRLTQEMYDSIMYIP